jgi:uncharacterized protein (TIGR02597 family)
MGAATSGTDPKDGSTYTVVANGTNTLTVSLNGDSLSTVPAGSTISVIPYWTLGTVFPPSASGTAFIASTSPLFPETEILVPNYSGTGTDLSASATYFFYNNIWCLVGDSVSNSHNDDPLMPDGYIMVRNPDTTTTLTAMGNVLTGNFMIPLATSATQQQDNSVAICRPVNTSLNNLGLTSGSAFAVTTSPLFTQDQVLIFSGTEAALDKSATATYFYYMGTSGTGWRLVGDSITNDHGTDTIPAGSGFVIRKASTANGNTAFWQNPPTY